ncbi:globin CTT-VI-like [Venturia canescens]|uniref:globin CTT-VI-like n=1 Tax=Venturia canescens TaxID=32260 RepID=UPI001C9C696E|nr:globin CTT-VI-like [Venturia canescens]XP_043278276.1 globin CTT-VI-like [Venturia canescens]
MGSIISYFFGADETDEIDPGTGLTAKQRNLIMKCWSELQPNIREIGVEIMITFFRNYPEYQEEFPKFRGRELEELANDRTFHAHCLNIMSTFEQAIEFLHDPELCVAALHMAGERHARRGQTTRPFEVLEPLVNEILKSHLNISGTTETSEALDIALALIFKELKHAIEEHDRSETNDSTKSRS